MSVTIRLNLEQSCPRCMFRSTVGLWVLRKKVGYDDPCEVTAGACLC